ncbi:MAG: hypothetical protein HY047_15940 [Acidobacteria bacterium]|nr:hypothetical protein [Acidobacteriota bacterium]
MSEKRAEHISGQILPITSSASSSHDDDAMMRRLPEPMTIEQLKKHMDGRLRTKADKADLRRLERRLDERFVRIDERFVAIDARFASVDDRLGMIDRRFDALEKALNARIDARFGSVNDKLTTILNILDKKYDNHQMILDLYEVRLQELEATPRA